MKGGKSYILMLSILEKVLRLYFFFKSSLMVLIIDILLTLLLEYAVEQYLGSDSLIAVSRLVSSKERSLVEDLLEPAMYLFKDFYAILEFSKGMTFKLILILWNVEIFKTKR
jgi:hypothetical protein